MMSFLQAQTTTLIDPSTVGGFESGNDFAANGWTVVNHTTSTNNNWFVGTTPVSFAGNNAAYVSNTNGTAYGYSTAISSTSHFYRDITVPAGQTKINLQFQWKGNGENGWDRLLVYTAPTTVTPVAGVPNSNSTVLTGATLAFTQVTFPQANYINASVFLPSNLAGTTFRLIFAWQNDGGGGTSPGSAVDNISLTSELPGDFISIITGNWNNPLTWDANAVPTNADNATVSATHVVSVNATGQGINNLIVNGTLAYTTTPTQFNVNGNLTIGSTGLANVFFTTFGKTLFVSGNITNNGRIDLSVGTGTAGLLNLNGSAAQTVSGIGTWGGTVANTTATNTSGVIRNLTVSNSSAATPNIIWSFDNIRIANNLNLTTARVNLGINKMVFGNYAAGAALIAPVGTGFLPGATFTRWWTTAATGTLITAGTDPINGTSRYPFLNATGTSNRATYISRTGSTVGNVAGELGVTYNGSTTMTTGLSIVDGSYTVTDRFDGNWVVTVGAGYVHAGTHNLVLFAQGAYPPLNGNSRIVLANAPAGGVHQNGTATPGVQRTGLSTGSLANTYFVGINTIDNQYPCVGTPAPGNTVASVTSACSGVNFTLSLQTTTLGIGLTYQWQSSNDGISWANVATGGTAATYTASQTVATYYRGLVTCSGATGTSTAVQVTMNIPTNCYCIPTTSFGCTDGDVIARVTLNTLDNNSGTGCPSGVGGNGYSNYTTDPLLTTTLQPSTTYNCTVYAGQYSEGYAAWIDYNDDGIFDNVTERIGFSNGQVTGSGEVGVLGSSATFPITLSCTPPAGVHRLRVRAMYATNGSAVTPCTNNAWGEVEDYLITITAAPACLSTGSPLTTVSTTSFTASISFPAGCSTASNFDIEYGPTGFTQGTGTLAANIAGTITGSNVALTIAGLLPQTTYDYYVRANCGSSLVSTWVGTGNATTLDPPCTGTPANPLATFNVDNEICPNQTASVSATGMTAGATGLSSIWQVSTNNVDWTPIAGATVSVYQSNPLSTGIYYYRYVTTCSETNLSGNSNSVMITVYSPPTVTISAPNNGAFCGTQTLTAAGAVSYVWSPASALSATTGNSVLFTGIANEIVVVTGTDANGCSASSAPFAITFTTPDPITFVATTPSFCGTGGTTSVAVSSATNYTYGLVNNSTAVITGFTATTFNATVTETSTFLITGTDPISGCVAQKSITIGVNPLPISNVTASLTNVCPGTAVTVNTGLSAQNFTSASIPFAALTAPISAVTLATGGLATPATDLGFGLDDGGWSNIPVGFGFNFFGTSYTTVSIGTNGTVFMGNTGNVGDYTFTTLPSINEPFNMIAVLAMDHNLNGVTGGTIKYWTEGITPNRKFVVNYESIQEFGATEFSTAQAILFETSGIAEVHVTSSTNVDRNKLVGINNGNGTEGVLAYASGTVASPTNPISTPFAYRFSPPANFTTVWTATTNGVATEIANGTNIFSQLVTVNDTTTYSISYTNQTTGCQNVAGSAQVTVNTLGSVAPIVNLIGATEACSGINFTVTSDYTGDLNGLTFQWQVSTDNITFTNIPAATNATLSVSQASASFYRLSVVSCSGAPAFSDTLSVGVSTPTNCYCIPNYTIGTSAGDLISNVSIFGTTLNNNTGFVAGGPSYTFFTGQPNYTATLLPSSSYVVNISTGEWGDQGYAAWIDYNDDGIFDASEKIGATPTTIGTGFTPGAINASSSFTIALACLPPAGIHRMRIRGVYFQDGVTIEPCATYSYGETEDYLITIAPAPTCPSPGLLVGGTTTTTTAVLDWSLGCSTASSFDFEYGPVGFTQGTGTLVLNQTAATTYTLANLVPNSTYDVYYRANCGAGDVSAWSIPTVVSTFCAPISLVNPGAQISCNSYTLPTLAEVTPSNNAGLVLSYRTQPNGAGTILSGNITTTQTVYIYGVAGACSANESFLVTINNSSTSTTNETACSSFTWNTTTYLSSGTFTFATPNVAGCDSVATLNLVINQPTTSILNVVACQTYTLNNETFITGGTYIQTLVNAAGCDSTITLNLTIGQPNTISLTEIACDSYSWNGTTYTTSGVFTETLTNAFGCDSVVTLNLTINNTSSSSAIASECVSYTWNTITYTASGTYTFVTPNAAGCDSTATLILTIGNNSSTTTAATCGSFTWTNGINYTASGTYTQTLVNAIGCDSLVTLNLTINPTPVATATDNGNGTGTLVASTGTSYQWIDCATNTPITGATSATYVAQINGSYAVIVTNASNCSATSTCVIVDYIGLDENTLSFNVYPNPTTGTVNIAIDQTTANYNVTVEDMNGRLVANFGSLINGNGVYTIDLSNVITGVYFIKLRNELEERTVRVIVQ